MQGPAYTRIQGVIVKSICRISVGGVLGCHTGFDLLGQGCQMKGQSILVSLAECVSLKYVIAGLSWQTKHQGFIDPPKGMQLLWIYQNPNTNVFFSINRSHACTEKDGMVWIVPCQGRALLPLALCL